MKAGLRCLLLLQACACLSAEPLGGLQPPADGTIAIIERSDLRKFENGVFVGVENREVRGVLGWSAEAAEGRVRGTFYVLAELAHAGSHIARMIEEAHTVSWAPGEESGGADRSYPAVRGFPVFPERALAGGDAWKAPGARLVEPLRDGRFTRVRFSCDYRYEGERDWEGTKVGVVAARYALRYKQGDDPLGDNSLTSVTGTHVVAIRLAPERTTARASAEAAAPEGSAARGTALAASEGTAAGGAAPAPGRAAPPAPSFMKDIVEETYRFSDGRTVSYKGFILTWFKGSAPVDRGKMADDIARSLKDSGAADVEVATRDQGVSLSINNVHFIAEQAVVLPEERPRLDAVAEALKKIPGRTFLVVGHTALAGSRESQKELSVMRARAMVELLAARGIPPERFLYKGRGAEEPVAPNDTEENMAKNRRVEIVILED